MFLRAKEKRALVREAGEALDDMGCTIAEVHQGKFE
jgi:hypothetical protein